MCQLSFRGIYMDTFILSSLQSKKSWFNLGPSSTTSKCGLRAINSHIVAVFFLFLCRLYFLLPKINELGCDSRECRRREEKAPFFSTSKRQLCSLKQRASSFVCLGDEECQTFGATATPLEVEVGCDREVVEIFIYPFLVWTLNVWGRLIKSLFIRNLNKALCAHWLNDLWTMGFHAH